MNQVLADAIYFAAGGTGCATPLTADYYRRKHGHRKDRARDHSGADPTAVTLSNTLANASAYISSYSGASASPLTVGGRIVPTMIPVGAAATNEPSAPEAESIPDLVEPIIALRAWTVTADGYLCAANQGVKWPAREPLTAICNKGAMSMMASWGLYIGSSKPEPPPPHVSPSAACSCGIYAAKDNEHMVYGDGVFVWGRVAMWGRVVEGEHGYRSQYAYPVSLVLVNRRGGSDEARLNAIEIAEIRERLATHYGVPVRVGSMAELDAHTAEEWEAMGLPEQVREIVG